MQGGQGGFRAVIWVQQMMPVPRNPPHHSCTALRRPNFSQRSELRHTANKRVVQRWFRRWFSDGSGLVQRWFSGWFSDGSGDGSAMVRRWFSDG